MLMKKEFYWYTPSGNDNQNNDIDENYPNKFYDSKEAEAYKAKHKKPFMPAFVPPDPRKQEQQQRPNYGYGYGGYPDQKYTPTIKPIPLDSAKYKLPQCRQLDRGLAQALIKMMIT